VQTFNVGHGTMCAGIAAATINNQIGVAGVAPNCRILPIAFNDATDVEVAHGIFFAMDRARVINMSFGNSTWDESVINPAIEAAHNNNVVMCAATGNKSLAVLEYPASHPLVIACGASNLSDNRWPSSNHGAGLDVMAPGFDIISTDIQGSGGFNPGSDYAFINGTSVATPHVTGLAALLLSADPTLSSNEVRDIIERTADKVGPDPYTEHPFDPNRPSWNPFMGHGRINVLRALQALQ
jgi:subtilisin family serine protease